MAKKKNNTTEIEKLEIKLEQGDIPFTDYYDLLVTYCKMLDDCKKQYLKLENENKHLRGVIAKIIINSDIVLSVKE